MSVRRDLALPPGGFSPERWYAFITWVSTLYYPREERLLRAFDAYAPADVFTFDQPPGENGQDTLLPAWRLVALDGWLLVMVQGTMSNGSLFQQFQAESQEPYALGPGVVSPLYQGMATAIYAQMQSRIANASSGRKILVLGHSLGAALATFVGDLIRRDFPGLLHKIVVFGSPKVGNANFAEAYIAPLVNVLGEDDIIGAFPLSGTPCNTALNLGNLFRGQAFGWEQTGQRFMLHADGTVWTGSGSARYDAPIETLVETFGDQQPLGFEKHQAHTYTSRLRRFLNTRRPRLSSGLFIAPLDAANLFMAELEGFTLFSRELGSAA